MCDPEYLVEREKQIVAIIEALISDPKDIKGSCNSGAHAEGVIVASILQDMTFLLSTIYTRQGMEDEESDKKAHSAVQGMVIDKVVSVIANIAMRDRRN